MEEDPPRRPSSAHDTLAQLLHDNAEVVLQALARAPDEPRFPLSALIAARTMAEVIDDVTRVLVQEARRAGHTWQEIGQVLRITRQAAQQRFGGTSMDDASTELAPLAQRSIEIIEQIRDRDWDRVAADWDQTMRTKLPIEQLAEVWQQLSRNAGALQAIGRPSIVRKGPYRIADVPLVFEHGPMKARVTFNHDNSVAGLFILLPDAE